MNERASPRTEHTYIYNHRHHQTFYQKWCQVNYILHFYPPFASFFTLIIQYSRTRDIDFGFAVMSPYSMHTMTLTT